MLQEASTEKTNNYNVSQVQLLGSILYHRSSLCERPAKALALVTERQEVQERQSVEQMCSPSEGGHGDAGELLLELFVGCGSPQQRHSFLGLERKQKAH